MASNQTHSEASLYHVDDLIASCNACGAHTLTRNPKLIKHYPTCGGIKEVQKWEDYYNDPEWEKAMTEEEEPIL